MQLIRLHILNININMQETVGCCIAFQLNGFQITVGNIKHPVVQRQVRHRGSIAVGSAVGVQGSNKRPFAVPVLRRLIFVLISAETKRRPLNRNIAGIDNIIVHRNILSGGTGVRVNRVITFEDIIAAFHIVVNYPGAANSIKCNSHRVFCRQSIINFAACRIFGIVS